MRRREIWIIVVAVVLIGALWTSCTVMNNEVADETAPIQRTGDQNSGTDAPNERAPTPGAEQNNPASPEAR